MKPPFLYKEKQPLVWSIDQWIELTKQLAEMGALDRLADEAKKGGIGVLLPPKTVNFIKMFLFEGRYHKQHETARKLITSATCPKKPEKPQPPEPLPKPEKPEKPEKPKPKATTPKPAKL